MSPEDALNGYIAGTAAWNTVIQSMVKLLMPSAIRYLEEITPRMPAPGGNKTDRRDAVEALLGTWPLAKFFGWHEDRVVRVERRDGEGVKVCQS